jgi:hypothetical protein
VVDSEEEDDEEEWVEAKDKSSVITVHNQDTLQGIFRTLVLLAATATCCAQPRHLARYFQNPCTTSSYYNSFDHVIEDCSMLLAKLQKRRGPQ